MHRDDITEHTFHFIGGPGGTDKSALFKKLHAACRKYGQPISICAATSLVKNPPPAPGSLFLGVAIRSASGRDLTRVPKPNSISGKPTSRSATRHFQKTIWLAGAISIF